MSGPATPLQSRRRMSPAEVLGLAQALHAQGKLAQAERAYAYVFAHMPDDPAAACGMGATLLALGRAAEAEKQLRRALEIDPAHIAARNNLGALLQASGRSAEALAHFEAATGLDPDRAEPLNNLGNALAALGRHAEALGPYERALALKPDFAEGRYNYGLALAALGRPEAAIAEFEQALALQPEHPRAHAGLGRALGARECFEEAAAHLARAIDLGLSTAELHNDLGAYLAALARGEDAERQFRRACALRPGYAVAHNNLGNTLAALDRYEEAVVCFQAAIRLDAGFAAAYANLGNALAELHHPDDALPLFERALAIDPNLAETHAHRGRAFVALGHLSDARDSFVRAIALQPDRAEFYNALAGCTRLGADDPHFLAMEALAERLPAMTEVEQTQLHFALAKAYEDQRRFEQAFAHYSAGNASRRRRMDYDEPTTLHRLQRFAPAFDGQAMRRAPPRGASPDVPIFIVGMPRSGSTLVEQILASHACVFGGGELSYFADEADRLVKDEGADLGEIVLAMTPADFAEIGARYRKKLRALAPDAPRIADKLPSNCQYLGLIRMALPDARIIHTRRDPVDTCLSCFAQTFSAGFAYSNDLGDLGRYYRAYADLMAHWRRVLPEWSMLEVQYEDLVADFEPQARRILDYCGLDWDARCLDFHETRRPVITASAAQVRQPIYQSSSGRAKAYGPLLQPLLDALGDALASSRAT